jgi:hypothetical protein
VEYGLAAAAILERVVLGESTCREALEWAAEEGSDRLSRGVSEPVQAQLRRVLAAVGREHTAVVDGEFGSSCQLPGSFLGAMHALQVHGYCCSTAHCCTGRVLLPTRLVRESHPTPACV